MYQYQSLVENVLTLGTNKANRTGVNTISLFGQSFAHKLSNGFPLLTTRKLHWKSIVYELLWFIRGDRDIQFLRDNGITIWDEWADQCGGLDTAYGFFWRHFPSFHCQSNSMCKHPAIVNNEHSIIWTDQLQTVINQLRNDPNSRRMLVSAWEPNNAWRSKLPPCHHSWCLYHLDGKVSIEVNMRSTDVGLGLPFNLASYSLLLMMICNITKMIPGYIKINMTDCHIYVNHVDALKEQLKRPVRALPTVWFSPGMKEIGDYEYQHIHLASYSPHDKIDMEIAV